MRPTNRNLYDQVISGIEAGSYSSFYIDGNWRAAWEGADAGKRNAFGKITIRDRYAIDGESDEPAGPPLKLTDAALRKGFDILLEKYPRHAADIIAENGDCITGDVLLQCAAFGDIVYG